MRYIRFVVGWLYFAIAWRAIPPRSVAKYIAPPFWHSRPVVKWCARRLGFRTGFSPAEMAHAQQVAARLGD